MEPPTPEPTPPAEARLGFTLGLAAYAFWGVVPIYWRMLHGFGALEILANRVVWGLGAFLILAVAMGVLPAARAALRDRRAMWTLLGSGVLLACNWGTFIYAVETDRVLQSSLGYFITPLVNVGLGTMVLGERLRRLQVLALGLATLGVVLLAVHAGGVPWIALVLAGTFGTYGLIRKTVAVPALAGSMIETALILPFAAGYLLWLYGGHQGGLPLANLHDALLLAASGPVTALPLAWFAAAARRLPLSTVGFLQYITPTGHLLTAVLLFHEPFERGALYAFAAIWCGLALFTLDLLGSDTRRRRARA